MAYGSSKEGGYGADIPVSRRAESITTAARLPLPEHLFWGKFTALMAR